MKRGKKEREKEGIKMDGWKKGRKGGRRKEKEGKGTKR
jgi:hypothetical protein